MPCKLDTGANCCVISRRDVAKLPDLPEQACRVALTAFIGHKATAQAKVRLRLSANERVVLETFYIIEQSVPVTLSGSAAERLEFIRRVQHIDVDQLYPPAQPFADVFTGLGELKDYEYEIKLKPGAVGVVVPARRIPVALEDKTRAELQRMEDQGVIRKRLMGRQTRTLLAVPASHLVPETVPNRAVHNRLQEIRQRQRIYYNRRSRNLPALSPGQRVTTYDTHERTWTPAVFLRPAETPRSVVVKTEEGQEIRRTREHLRDSPTHTEESPRDGSERLDDA
ncbi:uncharacterized protein LOC119379086 [Rhipicephalus sanguineus]|uniref:uncharacterized protein LOC119379086 n=1 Tax=Rhipicephalus sanguineus TaxID=34632 RepID=UPI0020C30C65|nr:uncharacterized protein LOC119379086 [Rhipicephalus sanguineus]